MQKILKNKFKLLILLVSFLSLTACGGGGGGGGGAAGGASSYTVSNCSDTGTDYQTTEYKYMGYGVSGNYNPLKFVCASAAYARGATGDGIKVAVLDTGVLAANADGATNTSHAELGNVVNFTSGSDAVNDDDTPHDDNGHGTHVAGIIAADKGDGGMHGVAYDASLYIFKNINAAGSSTTTILKTAMQKAIAAEVDIINNSYGWSDAGDGSYDGDKFLGSGDCNSAASCESTIGSAFYTQIEAAGTAGIINVWAAGNESNAEPSAVSGSAIYDDDFKETTVIVVATDTYTDFGGGNKIASYSNRCGSAAAICIAAPGSTVWSSDYAGTTSHSYKSGTSMAAPLVAGGLAIIKQEFSSLTNAQVVDRLFATATDSSEFSRTSIYGHGMMNLNAATTAVAQLQTINGNNLLDDPNTSYKDLVDNSFVSSASFSNALNSALNGQVMEVYDSFDRANFKVAVDSFFTSGSYTSQNNIENHMARLQPKSKQTTKQKNLYGSFSLETDGNYIESSMLQSPGNFLALGYNQSTNSFENAVDPLSNFFNDSNFGNNYFVNPYFSTGSGQDYFMSFNNNGSFGFDSFTTANGNDLGLAFNLNPLSSSDEGMKNAGDLQLVFGVNYEQNKFLNSTSSGVFATGDLSNTNFTGVKYKTNFGDDFTFVGSGFAGYTYLDKATNSYIESSTPLLTSSFSLGLAKARFIKKNQTIGFFINQPQRVEEGSLNLRLPTSSDRDRTVTYSNLNVDLEPEARQINYDIVFNKTITESSNLSVNLTHVKNGDHSNGTNDQNFISLYYKKTF